MTPSQRDQMIREAVAPHYGRKVAARAYEAECMRQGRQPNQKLLEAFLGSIGGDQ